jgi:hypothetical protein
MRLDGAPMRVELSNPRGDRDSYGRGPSDFGGRGPRDSRGPPQRTDFRVRVQGLPPSASWQDLKDHMRRVGDVGFSDVDRRGGGVVEYGTAEAMERAIRELNGSEFTNRFGDKAVLEVSEERGRGPPPREDRGRGGPRDEDRPSAGGPPPRDDDPYGVAVEADRPDHDSADAAPEAEAASEEPPQDGGVEVSPQDEDAPADHDDRED